VLAGEQQRRWRRAQGDEAAGEQSVDGFGEETRRVFGGWLVVVVGIQRLVRRSHLKVADDEKWEGIGLGSSM
jgi:hypothetical protein